MIDSSPNLLQVIGTRVAQRRTAAKLTLEEVATRTGVSRAMVSRIERGEVHASAVILDRLCAGLGISLSLLFAHQGTEPLARLSRQPVWRDPASGYLRREVTPPGTGSPIKIVEVEIPAGAEIAFPPSPHRVLDQHVWVLDGAVEAQVGNESYVLTKGDCLHMRLERGNGFRNRSRSSARYAVILTLETIK